MRPVDSSHFEHALTFETGFVGFGVVIRGSIQVLWGPNNFEQYFKTVKFDIQMVVKKDRYQYRFDHFVVKDGTREVQLEIYQSDTKLGGRYNPDFYREIESKIKVLSEELQSAMTKD